MTLECAKVGKWLSVLHDATARVELSHATCEWRLFANKPVVFIEMARRAYPSQHTYHTSMSRLHMQNLTEPQVKQLPNSSVNVPYTYVGTAYPIRF